MKSILFSIFFLLITLLSFGQEDLRIRKVKFKGNSHLSNSRLKEEITLESGSWIKEKIFGKEAVYYTHKLYEDDIKRLRIFYQKEGYLNVEFGKPQITVNKKQKVDVVVFITENEPVIITDISFKVDSTLALDEVLNYRENRKVVFQTETASTKIFRDEAIVNDKLIIAEAFYNRGYPYTIVEHDLEVDTASNTTKLNWSINRGPLSYFGPTIVEGNIRVPSKNIVRQLDYKEGDMWTKKKIDQSQKQIYNQGNYRVASVRTIIGEELLDTVLMRIQIKEAPRWETRFGVGYGREDKFRAFTEVQLLSFITNTGRLNFYAKHSGLEPYNIYLKFSQPSFLFPMNTLSIHPFMMRQNEPGYKLDKYGYNLTFYQSFSEELNTSIGFIYEDVELDTTNVSEFELPPDEESFYKKAGVVVGGIYNNSAPILDPVQGYAISFNTKTNDLFFTDEIPFFRILAEFKTYFGLKKGVVAALKAKVGGIKRNDSELFIPVEERFYAGGSHSVRGWSRSDLGPKDEGGTPVGGNSLLEGSAELRFDIGRKLKLAMFVDGGNVWLSSFSYDIKDLHYAAGAGMRYKTAIGPVGIDFARPVFDEETGWQIHFNIGHTF